MLLVICGVGDDGRIHAGDQPVGIAVNVEHGSPASWSACAKSFRISISDPQFAPLVIRYQFISGTSPATLLG
jgi:hypothetical protein